MFLDFHILNFKICYIMKELIFLKELILIKKKH